MAGPKTPEELAAIFDAADADKDGFLSPKELADMIRSKNDKVSDFQIAVSSSLESQHLTQGGANWTQMG